MIDRFDLCVPFTLAAEGGYDNDQSDPGNWCNGLLVGSNMGITAADVRTIYGNRFQITASFMKSLTKQFALRVLRLNYWNAVQAASLWPGLDLVVFDFGFNAGTATSIEELQRALGVTTDGIIGPKTLGAINAVSDHAGFLDRLANDELAHYRALRLWPRDGKGWANRVEAKVSLAKRMIADPTLSA